MPEVQILNSGCSDDCDDDCKRCGNDDDCKRGKRGKRGHRGHRGHDGPIGPGGPTGPEGPLLPLDINPASFINTGGGAPAIGPGKVSDNPLDGFIPLNLPVGLVIGDIRVRCEDIAGNQIQITFQVFQDNVGVTAVQAVSNGLGQIQTVSLKDSPTVGSLPKTVVALQTYALIFLAGAGFVDLYAIEIVPA